MATLEPRWRQFAVVLVLTAPFLFASACEPNEAEPPASPSAEIPDSPVGDQLRWLLGALEKSGRGITEEEVARRLTLAFKQQVPPARFLEVTEQVGADLNPFVVEGFEGEPSETHAVAVLRNQRGEAFRLTVTVEPDPPHLIAGALIQPATDLDEGAPTTWQEVDEVLRGAASDVGFLAAEFRDGACKPIHELQSEAPLAIGSTFKLYVLGAVAREVELGRATWDERLSIRDDLRSIPPGEMRAAEPGTRFALQEFARAMISVSDNTATDHLLERVGRRRVESFQRTMGNSHWRMNVPFLSTREVTILKLAADEEAGNYLSSSTENRRKLLATEIADAPLPSAAALTGWTEPLRIESLEWFASAHDLCRAMAYLKEMSERPGLHPIERILSTDATTLEGDAGTWPYVGFKGGSEPGVLNMTAILRRDDGRWFFVSMGLNDPTRDVEALSARRAITAALDLLAR